MIFGPIACFRRLESRFSGQNGPRSSEMKVYIEITGYIKNHQNFKILFWSRESKNMIFRIFPEFFRFRPGLARTGGCRDPGSRNRQPASSPRDNGFSVKRIFFNREILVLTSETTIPESRVRRLGI